MPSVQAIVLPTLSRPLEGSPTSPAPPVTEHHHVLAGFKVQRQRVWLEVRGQGATCGLIMQGFEARAIEQWVVDRSRVINQIAIFTGDDRDRICVNVYVPNPELGDPQRSWDRAQALLRRDGARAKETALGVLFVTASSHASPFLNPVVVPPGDADPRSLLYANIALRRLGCDSRRALSLTVEIGRDARERFLSLYRLPPVARHDGFVVTVLEVVKVVQAALALFGLGPCARMTTGSHHGSTVSLESPNAHEAIEPDGLLCDTTVRGISEWLHIGDALVPGMLDGGDGILPPAVLSALLSIVLSVRAMLQDLGVLHDSSDPFVHRSKLLRAYGKFLSSASSRIGRVDAASHLSIDGIQALHRAADEKRQSEGIRRVIKSKIDDVRDRLPTLSTEHESLRASGSHHIQNAETHDIDAFVSGLNADWGIRVDSVRGLWRLGKSGKLVRARRRLNHLDGTGRQVVTPSGGNYSDTGATTETDGEPHSLGIARGIRGIGDRTYRAGRSIGDGLTGLLERTQDNSRSSLIKSGSIRRGKDTLDSEVFLGAPMSEHEARRSRRPSPVPTVSHAGSSVLDLSRRNSHDGGELLLGPPSGLRPSLMHRSATTDAGRLAFSASPESLTFDLPDRPARRRRHSYSHPSNLTSIKRHVTPRRLAVDTAVAMAVRKMAVRHAQLAIIVSDLEALDRSSAQTYDDLEAPLARRRAEVKALAERADALLQRAADESLTELADLNGELDYTIHNQLKQQVRDVETSCASLDRTLAPRGELQQRVRWALSHSPSWSRQWLIDRVGPWLPGSKA